jgi:hypothetical protein
MNNSKTLEVQEVYVKDGEGQGRTSVLHWSDDKSKWVSPIPVKPQSGYLLSREELDILKKEIASEAWEAAQKWASAPMKQHRQGILRSGRKPPNYFEILDKEAYLNQLVTPK